MANSSMQKRSSNKKARDFNTLASQIVSEATGEATPKDIEEESKKNPAAVELGRRGGLKDGKARAEKLTPEQRSDIAKKAAQNAGPNS